MHFQRFISQAKLLCALFIFAAAYWSTPAQAQTAADFEFSKAGLSMKAISGRTLVGMTRDTSKTWSVYLSKSGTASFNFSTGKSASSKWYSRGNNIVCFKGLIKDKPLKEICKLITQRGRGLDWMTVELYKSNGKTVYRKVDKSERRGSSQIVFSHAGRMTVSKYSYRSDLRQWRGRVVVGRTLKDKEAWSAHFKQDGRVDFVFGSGKKASGRFTATQRQICMTFASNPNLNGCRKPYTKNGKVVWASSKNGSYISEIVYMYKPVVRKPTPPKPVKVYAAKAKTYGTGYFEIFTGHLPGNKFAVQTGLLESTFRIIETKRGIVQAELKRKGVVLAPDLYGLKMAWIESRKNFHVWDFSDQSQVAITSETLDGRDFDTIAINRAGNIVALVEDDSDRVLLWDVGEKKIFKEIEVASEEKIKLVGFGSFGPYLHIKVDGKIIRTVNIETGESTEISAASGSKIIDFQMSESRREAVLVERTANKKATYISSYESRSGAWLLKKRIKSQSSLAGNVSISLDGKEALVSVKDKGIYAYSLPHLSNKTLVTGRTSGGIRHFGQDGAFLVWKFLEKGTRLYGRSQTQAQRFKGTYGAYKFELAALVTEETKRVKAVIAEEKAEYDALLTLATGHYDAGRCGEYDAIAPELRRSDVNKTDCETAATLRQKEQAYQAALRAMDCEESRALHTAYDVGSRSDISKCLRQRQRRDDLLAFSKALKAEDCDAIEALEGRVGREGAGAECKLKLALASDSPRRMFLSAVKFDTNGAFEEAKQSYEAIMERFPEDDVALQAATRVVALTDQLRNRQKADQEALKTQAALREAKRVAEAARKRAEATERAAKEAAERERKTQDRIRKERERKAKRVATIKSLMADLNAKYGLHSGYHQISTTISGTERYYDISGKFKITPTVLSPTTSREFCKVKIESSTYPRYSKITLPNNKYFNPEEGKSSFIVNLAAENPAGTWGGGKHLYKKAGENKVKFTSYHNGDQAKIEWVIPVQKLQQSGHHYKSGSRVTYMQLFSDGDQFFEEFSKLVGACYRGRND